MRISTWSAALAVTALATVALVGSTAGSASAACTPTWRLLPAPAASQNMDVSSVDVASAHSVWMTSRTTSGASRAAILRSNGASVSTVPHQIPVPPLTSQTVTTGSFSSDTEGWVLSASHPTFQLDGGQMPTAQHWHQGRWITTPLPVPYDVEGTVHQQLSVATVSATNAWIVGGVFENAGIVGTHAIGALIEHWDGTRWSIVDNPAAEAERGALYDLDVLSATDIWAVGTRDVGTNHVPLVEHWDGTSWTIVDAPAGTGPTSLKRVSGTSSHDVWALGTQTIPGTINSANALVEHWDGTHWAVVTDFVDYGNSAGIDIFAASPTSVWAAIQTPDGVQDFAHWDGTAWSTVPVPGPQALGYRHFYNSLDGTGANDVWAVGLKVDKATLITSAQIAHLSCGA
jgi:hypothetical protein